MDKFVVALDVDDVCLELMENWLKFYNHDFNDFLTSNDITAWDIGKFVKPNARKYIYRYIEEPEVFLTAHPVEGALQGVKILKSAGFRVVYVTANNPEKAKETWLMDNGFMEDRSDFYQAYDKSLIHADFLLDDKYDNVVSFKYGVGCLFSRPTNQHYLHHNRVNSWPEFIKLVKKKVNWEW